MNQGETTDVKALVKDLTRQISGLDSGKLESYLTEIIEWNPHLGLVSKRSTTEVLARLVVQSAQMLDIITGKEPDTRAQRPLMVVDIGTGGGFPGIIWKIKKPELGLTLIERKSKKTAFLSRIVVILGMRDVEVLEADASEVRSNEKYRGRYDLAVTMAVGSAQRLSKAVEGFLRPQGYYCSVRPIGESIQPERIGSKLVLRDKIPSARGIFCIYQKDG